MTTRLVLLRRLLLIGSGVLVLLSLALVVGTAPSRDRIQVILPRWTDDVANLGLALLVLSQVVAAAARRGWRRLVPLVVLVPAALAAVMVIGLARVGLQRVEINRVTLPDGRVVMMTLEPGLTDTVYGLWEPYGWRWRSLFEADWEITYSEDHSFTSNPRLLVSADGRRLLIGRGGIWTDCWSTEARLTPCPSLDGRRIGHRVERRDEWLGRSARIAADAGEDPPPP